MDTHFLRAPLQACMLTLVAALALAAAPARAATAPTFSDPVALVTWLIQHSGGHGFQEQDDAASATVFSPGLRAAIRASFARSRQRNEPPCGADGDFILETQEDGPVTNLRVSSQPTASDRATVATSFDIVGYHRSPKFMAVLLDGAWKVENIVSAEGVSLRRSLACGR
jgi:hypothetical protein